MFLLLLLIPFSIFFSLLWIDAGSRVEVLYCFVLSPLNAIRQRGCPWAMEFFGVGEEETTKVVIQINGFNSR